MQAEKDRDVFHFIIDDTGTKDPVDFKTPTFAYVGVMVRRSNLRFVEERITDVISKYLKPEIEIKSRWFRFPDERKKYYLDPCGMDDKKFTDFSTELFSTISRLPIRCIGSIVDKNKMNRTYSKVVFSPSPVCYDLLLQRAANFGTQYNTKDIIIFVDDMSGKTAKGNEWKKLLINQHRNLKLGKSPFYRTWKTRTGMDYSKISTDITFLDSRSSLLVQVADLCAYSVMRQGKDSWGNFDDPPFYPGYQWIKCIMHRDPKSGKIGQYGALCFPE